MKEVASKAYSVENSQLFQISSDPNKQIGTKYLISKKEINKTEKLSCFFSRKCLWLRFKSAMLS